MNPTFDLLKEPWIPVIRGDEIVEMNLTDVLYSAHKISAISDSLPIAEFGLYRFLVALVMDVYQLKDSIDLDELLDTGSFDPARIDNYFREWGHCFDLFDSKQPFLQTADMGAFSDKPLSGLLPCVPSGTNAGHFHHFDESDFAVSPALAARLLTTIAPFMTAGGAGLAPSINGAPPWYVLINGVDDNKRNNLFRTICLNCFVGPSELPDSLPAWRNPLPPKTDGRSTKTGLLEALTWRPRQISLVPGGPGICSLSGKQSSVLIRSMKFRAGASCDFNWTDPSVPYKITDKGSLVMRPREGKEIWRDTGPLALLNDRAYGSSDAAVKFARPRLIDQFEDLFRYKDEALLLTVYGMRTDMKMKVFEWQKEKLRVPAKLVIGSKFALFAQDCIDEAGSVENALRKAIKHLARDDGKGNANALDTLIANATRQYWSTLRSVYSKLLDKLAALPVYEHAEARFPLQDEWRENERRIVMNVFSEVSDGLDTYGDNIQRQVEAERNLWMNLGRIFQTIEQKDARKKKSKADNILTEGGDKQ